MAVEICDYLLPSDRLNLSLVNKNLRQCLGPQVVQNFRRKFDDRVAGSGLFHLYKAIAGLMGTRNYAFTGSSVLSAFLGVRWENQDLDVVYDGDAPLDFSSCDLRDHPHLGILRPKKNYQKDSFEGTELKWDLIYKWRAEREAEKEAKRMESRVKRRKIDRGEDDSYDLGDRGQEEEEDEEEDSRSVDEEEYDPLPPKEDYPQGYVVNSVYFEVDPEKVHEMEETKFFKVDFVFAKHGIPAHVAKYDLDACRCLYYPRAKQLYVCRPEATLAFRTCVRDDMQDAYKTKLISYINGSRRYKEGYDREMDRIVKYFRRGFQICFADGWSYSKYHGRTQLLTV